MIINPVNLNKIASTYNNTAQINTLNESPKTDALTKAVTEKTALPKVDTLELGNNTQESFGTYKIDRQKLNEIRLDFKKNSDSFKEMVRAMIEKQGFKANEIIKAMENGEKPVIKVDDETRVKAQEAIAEDGYWGVNKTSERILEFAKTISGGDPSKIETLKNAFIEGFKNAKEAFGGELPEISQQTYDKVMKGFESWANPETPKASE